MNTLPDVTPEEYAVLEKMTRYRDLAEVINLREDDRRIPNDFEVDLCNAMAPRKLCFRYEDTFHPGHYRWCATNVGWDVVRTWKEATKLESESQ